MISLNKDIRLVPCDEFLPMGTPEQINDFWNISLGELKNMNIINNYAN